MTVHVGVKSDPIENRYSFDWLFDLMAEQHAGWLQLGSSYPFFHADPAWFRDLARKAERRGIRIASTYTSYREMTGFFVDDPHLEDASRRAWERLIQVASWVGASSAGSSCGSVLRDQPGQKEPGLARWFRHMKDLTRTAKTAGLSALCIEPMSSLFEPPSTPEEMDRVTREMDAFHAADPAGTVPVRFCADISHGLADRERRVVVDNWRLFEAGIPHTHEFHFKNTDDLRVLRGGARPGHRGPRAVQGADRRQRAPVPGSRDRRVPGASGAEDRAGLHRHTVGAGAPRVALGPQGRVRLTHTFSARRPPGPAPAGRTLSGSSRRATVPA
jgi:sugar phosphate isomerase/epimerase